MSAFLPTLQMQVKIIENKEGRSEGMPADNRLDHQWRAHALQLAAG